MIKFPPFLKPGDTVGVLAPAGYINYQDLQPGLSYLRDSWGLNVCEGSALTHISGQFAGSDQERLADLQSMLDNPDIKAIFAARGGYGCSRIIDGIDWTHFKKNPKWIIGFSDLTVLLTHLYKEGFASIHGAMIRHLMQPEGEQALSSLRQILSGDLIRYQTISHDFNHKGTATGEILGGNLCLFTHLIGSVSQPDTEGKILFLEDVGEYYYNLDRMVIQMKRAGIFDKLSGLIIGQFSDMKDLSSSDFGMTAWEIINYHTKDFSYPKVYNFPVGHVEDNRAIPIGSTVRLEVTDEGSTLDIFLNSNYSL